MIAGNAEQVLEQVILALREIDLKGTEVVWGSSDKPVVCRSQGANDIHNLLASLGREHTRLEILQHSRPGYVPKEA